MSVTKWIQKMTPKQAWDEFVAASVELFISNFRMDGYTNIAEACSRYSKDLPTLYYRPFLQVQLDHVAGLLEEYINDYLRMKGGLSALRLYTNAELDAILENNIRKLQR